ncbi:MAG TPA: hypothetical protein VGA55_08625 [Bacteroidota bacterium]
MAFVKEASCRKCGKKFFWKIERPGDGFWDRWRSDDGNILGSWFLASSLCWDHAFEVMPEEFKSVIRTVAYHEENAATGQS